MDELLILAWGVIANVSEGDWSRQNEEWQSAAASWRDRYHAYLDDMYVDGVPV